MYSVFVYVRNVEMNVGENDYLNWVYWLFVCSKEGIYFFLIIWMIFCCKFLLNFVFVFFNVGIFVFRIVRDDMYV